MNYWNLWLLVIGAWVVFVFVLPSPRRVKEARRERQRLASKPDPVEVEARQLALEEVEDIEWACGLDCRTNVMRSTDTDEVTANDIGGVKCQWIEWPDPRQEATADALWIATGVRLNPPINNAQDCVDPS